MSVLVTGGAGFIGSHTCVELLESGFDVVVCDNLSNASEEALNRVKKITGKTVKFYKTDIRDREGLDTIFEKESIDSVIHFAGLKAVGESVEKPLMYYDNNIHGTLVLCEAMKKAGCKSIVFSSSATVYGDPHTVPIKEDFPLHATNPYGRTKLMIEEILQDLCVSDPEWKVILLRYFNPIGAHESGLIGEDPKGIPNNLVPYVAQVAIGKHEFVRVFGNDYNTPDGTGVRDYIHVVDLAKGNGYSVLDVVKAYSKACGKELPYKILDRRPGDIATCYADPAKAKAELGWEAQFGIERMCADSWRWQSTNPEGYAAR